MLCSITGGYVYYIYMHVYVYIYICALIFMSISTLPSIFLLAVLLSGRLCNLHRLWRGALRDLDAVRGHRWVTSQPGGSDMYCLRIKLTLYNIVYPNNGYIYKYMVQYRHTHRCISCIGRQIHNVYVYRGFYFRNAWCAFGLGFIPCPNCALVGKGLVMGGKSYTRCMCSAWDDGDIDDSCDAQERYGKRQT